MGLGCQNVWGLCTGHPRPLCSNVLSVVWPHLLLLCCVCQVVLEYTMRNTLDEWGRGQLGLGQQDNWGH